MTHYTSTPLPGDPEGAEADNWTRLVEGPIEFPQAPEAGTPNTATYTLTQTFGGTASATTPAHEWTGKGLDVAFFDLTELRPGYVFAVTCTTVSATHHPGAFEQVVGITFDTGIARPREPSSTRESTR